MSRQQQEFLPITTYHKAYHVARYQYERETYQQRLLKWYDEKLRSLDEHKKLHKHKCVIF